MSTHQGGNDCCTISQFQQDILVTLQEGAYEILEVKKMAVDLIILGAAILGLFAASAGGFLILNVIGDSVGFIGAVCFAIPAAILTLLSALGVSIMI